MYSSTRSKQIVKKDVAFLSAGIHDNVLLTGIRKDTTPLGNNFLEFKFEKDGKTGTHTEWEPKNQGNLSETEYIDRCTRQLARIEQILECYYPEDSVSFEGSSFNDLGNWVTNMYNQADKNTKLRVKFVFNDKGYTTLPNYAKYTFIEPMSKVEAGESKIAQLTIDMFEKPVVADSDQKVSHPYADVVQATVHTDATGTGLPF